MSNLIFALWVSLIPIWAGAIAIYRWGKRAGIEARMDNDDLKTMIEAHVRIAALYDHLGLESGAYHEHDEHYWARRLEKRLNVRKA